MLSTKHAVSRLMTFLTVGFLALCLSTNLEAGKKSLRPQKYNPAAEKVDDLFVAMESGKVDVKIIAKNSKGGNVLITNNESKPLNVKLPETFLAVQVLKQGALGGGLGGGLGGQGQGGQGGGQTTGGGGQGGLGGGLGGQGGAGGAGGGFFSIPPEKTVYVPYTSVCLEHGKLEPAPRMDYRMVRTEEMVKDPALQELLKFVATGRVNQQAGQAAAWHLANKMSWQQLASKSVKHLGGAPSTPYFKTNEIQFAAQLVGMAQERARNRKETASSSEQKTQTRKETVRSFSR
ncbi:MAG: hypothetical protein K0U86_03865 [Planctomycetes bacterium]|nr:hypothetical protein [Planctomycetota bacterium]MCH9724021.1 hypothetical protein [Planctomycetota bacterium]MCH9778077.1 hypothetical protein [Planctomycetota bacterium]MCH9790794.1 hypothetical protein [Planctomycetota bacterium]MDF1744032.1 hypothetical protein [Gimesia sp.]